MSTGHAAASASFRNRGRLRWVLAITAVFLVAEVVGGLLSDSLALLADAGHMLTDVSGLGLALFAIWLAHRPSRPERSFGWYRVEILAAMVNGTLLLVVSGTVLFEAWQRWSRPPEIASGLMLGVALAGLVANAVSMALLRRGQRESLNLRAAYLEVLGDLLGSLAVIVAAVTIALTGLRRADAVASAAIGLLILPRTWSLLRDAVDVLLQATPKGVDLSEVRRHIAGTDHVEDVHDLHVWTITSGMNVVSAHVVLSDGADPARVLDDLCACLSDDFDIEHSTFQLETRDRRRVEESSHP
ncbi:MAG TPA: cation diffusion facilitator family transporter [Actinomycetota bacterium]|nr:cation diffusion facilitator family transporter [Actinomycetota bacterium]